MTSELKKPKTEETSDPTSASTRKNKIIAESSGPSSSTARPIPTPPPAPVRTPQPPDHPPPLTPKEPGYPPPNRPDMPTKAPRKPFDHGKYPHPTPPAPPIRVLSDFWQNIGQSDTTDQREPLPRQRQEQQDDDTERPPIDLEYHANSKMNAYVAVMNSIAGTVPDSFEAREQRAIVWERIADLVGRGVTIGSRMLDRMILQGRDTVEISQNIFHLPYVPSPAEHFMRQDPGEAGAMCRPSLMIKIEDDEYNWDVLDALGALRD